MKVNPAGLAVEKDYEDYDARPEIAAMLDRQGFAEIHHEASGVRVRVKLDRGSSGGYSLEVPTASLDPEGGSRHRARQAIAEAGWRLYDGDTGTGPDLEDEADEPGASWGFSVYHGDAKAAAAGAHRLLCAIAELPVDAPIKVRSRPSS